jgi:hypothetical protein
MRPACRQGVMMAYLAAASALLPLGPVLLPGGPALGGASCSAIAERSRPSACAQAPVHARRWAPRCVTAWRASAGDLFEPTFQSHLLYQQAEVQMRQLYGNKCNDAATKALDEEFWQELEGRLAPAADAEASDPSSLWRFRHFLTKQRIIALPLTGRTRIEGVTRLSLGPLKDLDNNRR